MLQEGYGRFYKYARIITFLLFIVWSLYQVCSVNLFIVQTNIHRAIHLTFGLLLVFLIFPLRSQKSIGGLGIDLVFVAMTIVVNTYLIINFKEIIYRVGNPNTTDIVFGIILILLVLEAARRSIGIALPLVSIIFVAYGLAGPYLPFPELLGHRGFSLSNIINTQYISMLGIFSIPIGVSSTFVFLFVLFGAFLEVSGAGEFFNNLAYAATGRMVGGPAKTAVVASGLMGSISGSTGANVMTTGAFTIPMMKKMGFKAHFAGAVEAAASTGGQIMPPVMGVVAFLIADFLSIPYIKVAVMAAIPAILYFLTLFLAIHFEAKKTGMVPPAHEELPCLRDIIKDGWFFVLPVILLVYLLAEDYSPTLAAFYSIILILILSMIRTLLRTGIRGILAEVLAWASALERAGRNMLVVVSSCACAGIILGMVSLTGLGFKFTFTVTQLAGHSLILLLCVAMIACIILGTGLTSVPSYILVAILIAPGLVDQGIMPLGVHLFIFYYAVLSFITPPVALAAYFASGIAGADPLKIGFTAMRLALPGFIVPFLFVYNPSLLLQGSIPNIILSVGLTVLGFSVLTSGLVGYFRKDIGIFDRILLLGSGALLLYPLKLPSIYVNLAGMATFLVFCLRDRFLIGKH